MQHANVNASPIREGDIKDIDIQINSISKLYNLKESDDILNTSFNAMGKLRHDIDISGWFSMGIWNRFSVAQFQGKTENSIWEGLSNSSVLQYIASLLYFRNV